MPFRSRAGCAAAAALALLLLSAASAEATLQPIFQERGVSADFLLPPPCFGFFVFDDFAADFGFFEGAVTESKTCEGVGTSSASLFETSSFQANGFTATGTSSISFGGVPLSFDAGGEIEIEIRGAYTFTLAGTFDSTGPLDLAHVLFSTPSQSESADTPGPFYFSGVIGSPDGPPQVFLLEYFFFSKDLGSESASASYDVTLRFAKVAPLPAASGKGRVSIVALTMGTGLLALVARSRAARASP